jgi:hypothetical protein
MESRMKNKKIKKNGLEHNGLKPKTKHFNLLL